MYIYITAVNHKEQKSHLSGDTLKPKSKEYWSAAAAAAAATAAAATVFQLILCQHLLTERGGVMQDLFYLLGMFIIIQKIF